MKTTVYFDRFVSKKHPESIQYLDDVEKALTQYLKLEHQSDGRTRRWVYIEEAKKYMRAIVEPDGQTIHNAFFDRDYERRHKK